MIDNIKFITINILRNILKVFWIVPIKKNRILFTSYLGNSYSCNPKYIYKYLKSKYPNDYELVWAFNNPSDYVEKINDKCIKYKSLKWLYYEITSNVIIGNNGGAWVPMRKSQLRIDTWHGGGCYKKVGLDKNTQNYLISKRLSISSKETNLFLSSSRYFSDEVVRKSFKYEGEILECGMPRNDIFFHPTRISNEYRDKINKYFSINKEMFIVLYAPTWRESMVEIEPIDINLIKKAVKKRYNKEAVVIVRAHRVMKNILKDNMIDATDYPDMQELLMATDMLITDYSSSIWDYSYKYSPCFLYAPDLEDYTKKVGFDEPIKSWGFPVCCSNLELYNEICDFSLRSFREKMIIHHEKLESFETGTACEKVANKIYKVCNYKKKEKKI